MLVEVGAGVCLDVVESGNRANPSLLLLCGTTQHSLLCGELAAGLARDYHVISFDRRGVGESECGGGSISPVGMAEDAAAVLDAVGVSAAYVLGWSQGALVAQELTLAHPEKVTSLVLYADGGQTPTSTGAVAGLELCLRLIRRDCGSAVATDAAPLSVMPPEREGDQARFIAHELSSTPRGSVLEPVLRWMEENAARDLSLEDIARHGGMSVRTLLRRFREQTGTTPLQWLHRARVRQAQLLLETTTQPVEWIARLVGFGSPAAFRDRFKRVTGVTPQAYRSASNRLGAQNKGPRQSVGR
jgi:AraC-like DNA-binding protein